MVWSIAGKRGMEMHGFRADNGEVDTSKPDIRIITGALKWTFSFKDIEGSGQVRVGPGTNFNPIQAIEALWAHVMDMENDTAGLELLESDEDLAKWYSSLPEEYR